MGKKKKGRKKKDAPKPPWIQLKEDTNCSWSEICVFAVASFLIGFVLICMGAFLVHLIG
jgi:hypothetical protein